MTHAGIDVAAGNADQASHWDGPEGDYWAQNDERYNASIAHHTARLLGAAAVGPAERVLDVGCGCGETTREAARAASGGSALGVDLSAAMLARARERAGSEGVANVRFQQADAQVHPFERGAFDVAISRFGTMFFADRRAALANVARALRPGGRLAFLSWQEPSRNEWLLAIRGALAPFLPPPAPPEPGAAGPFSLSDPEVVRATLAAAYEDVRVEPVEAPFFAGRDADDAHAFLGGAPLVGGMLAPLDAEARARALESLRATLAGHEQPDGVRFGSAAWLVTARVRGRN